eukprot:gene4335-7691_t
MFCRHLAVECINFIPKLQDKCELVLCSSGTPKMAKAFEKEFIPKDSRVTLYLDEKLSVYKYFQCKKPNLLQALAGINMSKTSQVMKKGFKQGAVQGDMNQLGGLFIIDKNGKVIYQFFEQYAGNDPDFDDLSKFIEKM